MTSGNKIIKTRPKADLSVHPWFYDALSGQLRPPMDQPRTRTLGELASAAYDQGSRTHDMGAGWRVFEGEQYSYQPAWAPTITARVLCKGMGSLDLRGLSLSDGSLNLLTVEDTSDLPRHDNGGISIYDGTELIEIPAAEARLEGAQRVVTEAAMEFFYQSALDMQCD
ncbi:MAG: hypothetical protein AAB436_03110 [Patescibacteria group bacterium]